MRFKLEMLICMLCFCVPLAAQWVPVTAIRTSVDETISASGSVLNREERIERYMRSTTGSVLSQHLSRTGIPTDALLIDHGNTHRVFVIAYESGAALDKGKRLKDIPVHKGVEEWTAAQRKNILGEEVLQGIHCVIMPVYFYDPATKLRTIIGKAWLAPDLNFLIMKEDSTQPNPDGSKLHTVSEVQSITVGVEPDHSFFATDSESIKCASALSRKLKP